MAEREIEPVEDLTKPMPFFETISEELAYRREHMRRESDETSELAAFALRVEPVCRNCVHAGVLSYSGNYPYNNEWGSCEQGPPVAAPHPSNVEQYTSANVGRWPAVHHTATCGSFKLRPLEKPRPDRATHFTVKWSWQKDTDA